METIDTILLVVVLALVIYGLAQNQKKKLSKPNSQRRVILDTCALIDGRILDLSKSGFIPDELIVPEFIINELQLLADGSDSHKRERARFGLDVIKELQNSKNCRVIIDNFLAGERQPTDDRLIALSKKRGAPLYTTDYNLNKVAEIQGVSVLNVNELAQQLRPSVLPGEHKSVKIIQKGSNHNQGVGYLDDGTMVVVEAASHSIGKTIEVEVDRTFQTVAGKMIFAQAINKPARPPAR